MKIEINPKLEVGDRVYVETVSEEPNFITPARGEVKKIDYQGWDEKGREIIKYEVEWDKGTIGGLPIMAPFDVFYANILINHNVSKKKRIKIPIKAILGTIAKKLVILLGAPS